MKIQGVRLQGTKLVPSGAAVVESDTYFNLVSLLLPGNGTNGQTNNTFIDSSTNNFTITRAGNTTQGTFSPFSQTGWSGYFDRTGQLDVPESAISGVGSSNFSIECWVYATTQTNTFAQGLVTYGVFGSTSGTSYISFQLTDSGNLAVAYAEANALTLSDPSLFPINQWVHAVVCRSGSTLSLFVNGTRVATTTTSATVGSSGDVLSIGGQWFADVSTRKLQGYISNVRIVNGSSAYDATASTLTVPTAPLTAITNTSLLTCQSNRFIDNSSNAFAITVGGNTAVQAFSPFDPATAYAAGTVGGSAYFDGTGDYLTAAQNAAFNLGTGAFTVEGFFYLTSFASTNRIVGLGDGASGGSPLTYTGWTLSFTSTVIRWYRYDGTETNYTANATINLNQWNHVAVSRDGSGNLAIFFNGVRILNQAGVTTAYNNVNANPLYIGRIDDGNPATPKYVTGYISNVRIVNGSAVYNPTSSTLVVPTAPLTAITNTQLLLNYTNGGITDATAKGVFETVGGAAISTAQSKWGGSAMAFDGSGDYLVSPASVNYEVGTGSYTIEFWVYWNVIGNIAMLFGWNGGATGSTFGYTYSDGRIGVGINGTNEIVSSSGQATTGSWIHMAFVKNGSTTTIYKNGVAIASSTTGVWSSNTGTATFSVGGGASASDTNCYIDDLRITKGYARYTADFTAPTTAFPVQ